MKKVIIVAIAAACFNPLFAAEKNTNEKATKVNLTNQQKEIFIKTAALANKITGKVATKKESADSNLNKNLRESPIRTHTECGYLSSRDAEYGMDIFLGNVHGSAEWYDTYQDSSQMLVRFCYTVGYRASR